MDPMDPTVVKVYEAMDLTMKRMDRERIMAKTDLDSQTVGQALNELIGLGLVQKHGRGKYALTDKGQAERGYTPRGRRQVSRAQAEQSLVPQVLPQPLEQEKFEVVLNLGNNDLFVTRDDDESIAVESTRHRFKYVNVRKLVTITSIAVLIIVGLSQFLPT